MRRSTLAATRLAVALSVTALAACSKKDTASPIGPAEPVPETYVAQMTAGKELPNPLTTGAVGTATFVFTPTNGITYKIDVTGLSASPSAMHIHAPGDATQLAPVIVGFNGYAVSTSGPIASGTILGVSATVSLDSLKALIRGGKVYAQVHTTAFGGGEIRAQLVKQ